MRSILNVILLVLDLYVWLLIAAAILSWLVAFNVLNTASEGIRRFVVGLDRFLEPLYRPFRRILPDFGGLDLSPMVVLLLMLKSGKAPVPH